MGATSHAPVPGKPGGRIYIYIYVYMYIYIEALIPCIVHILTLHFCGQLPLAGDHDFVQYVFRVFREFHVFRFIFRKREIHEKHNDNTFFQEGPCRSREGPDPCATSCFTHFRLEMRKQKKHEKNMFFRNAIGIEMARMTFGGSGRSFSGPSKFEKYTFSMNKMRENTRVHCSPVFWLLTRVS